MQFQLFALATSLAAISFPTTPAYANDLGGRVLLCLSNPGGATQYGDCIKPMSQLWQRLATGGSLPGCTGGSVAKTKVHDRNSATRRRVVMTYADGRQETHSLANIDRVAAPTSALEGTAE